MDTNKVPKAEDSKKWKVWPTTHLVMFFSVDLISLCYMSSINLLPALCHYFVMQPALLCVLSSVSFRVNVFPIFLIMFFWVFWNIKSIPATHPLFWLIMNSKNSCCQLILSGLPVSWLLLQQNINDRLFVWCSPGGCKRTTSVFRGHTLALQVASSSKHLLTSETTKSKWPLTSSSVKFTEGCAFQAVASSS